MQPGLADDAVAVHCLASAEGDEVGLKVDSGVHRLGEDQPGRGRHQRGGGGVGAEQRPHVAQLGGGWRGGVRGEAGLGAELARGEERTAGNAYERGGERRGGE